MYPGRTVEIIGDKTVSVEKMIANAEQAIDNKHKANFIVRYTSLDRASMVQIYKFKPLEETGLFTWYGETMDYFYRIYVDPYSGKVLEVENTKWEFFNLVEFTHTSLLLGPIGNRIIALSVLFFLILVVTGIILWWPKNKKAFKMNTWFRWKPTTKWKRKNYDLHNILGFYASLVLLVSIITGLSWSYEWFKNGVHWFANMGYKKTQVTNQMSNTNLNSVQIEDPIEFVDKTIQQKYPNSIRYWLTPSTTKISPINIYIDNGHITEAIIETYDSQNGKLIQKKTMHDFDNGGKIDWMNYDIHTGSILGFPGKLLAFFASLISASLPITGFLIWYNRKFKKRRKASKPSKLKVTT